jgi:imidazolonepropionase-like amidohydrolase
MSGKVPLLHFPKNARRTLPPMLEHVRCGGNGFLRLVQHAKFGQGGLLRVLEHASFGRGGLSRPPLWRKCSSFQLQCVRFAGALKPKKSIAERGTDAGHKSPALPSVLLASILLVLATFASAQTPRQKTRMATSQVEATGPIAIRGGKLLTITHGVIENGVVLMENGKITAVGPAGTAIPRGATVVDATGMTVYPGLIDSETNLGLVEVEADQMSNDLNEPSDEIMPHMHVADAFHSETQRIPVVRVNGITNAIVAPGSDDSLPGQDILIQLDGKDRDQMIMARDVAMPLNFSAEQRRRGGRGEGGGISNRFPSTRMGLATQLRQAFIDAQDYDAKQQAAATKKPDGGGNKSGSGSGDRQKRDLKLEALLPYLHGQKPVVIGARDGYDLENAMRLAREFNLKVVLNHVTHSQQILDEIASWKVPVIVGPIYDFPRSDERYDAVYSLPAELVKRGVKIAFASYKVEHNRNLPYAAGYAVAFGLPYEEALKAITINPAEIWGVADKLGSLEVGKIANVVIANGDPLDVKTDVKQVFIDGRKIPMENRQTRLRDEYGGVPPAPSTSR